MLKEFDDLIKKMKYNRSKAIQISFRNYLSEYKWKNGKGLETGAIILLYDHSIKGLEEELIDVQHHFLPILFSSMYILDLI